jgi:chromosome partitioning protein
VPIIAVANQKGGVGKTTSTLNLGAALQEAGKRVLLVDLDPQGNLSVAAGILDIDAAYPSIGDLLALAARGRSSSGPGIEGAVVHSPSGLDIVPANATLSAAELGLVSAMNRESMLASLLKPVESTYDYVLIDCLPSLGLLAINALRAANGIVIPVQADFLAMQGLAQIFETIAAVREQLNPDLSIYGVLLTLVDQRTAHSRDVVKAVRKSLDGQVNIFGTEVRLHVALKESAKAGRSILELDSKSPSAAAYRGLAREVLAVLGDKASMPAAADEPVLEHESELAPNLLNLPILAAAAPEPEPQLVVAHAPKADAPDFETFVLEGWQRWLGASR